MSNFFWDTILDADKRYVWHPYASAIDAPTVFPVVAAQGVRLELADGRELLTGNRVSIADCTLQSACQFARFGKAELLDDYPLIQAWDARYRVRPAAVEVLKF